MASISLLLYITVIYLRPQEWIPAVYGWQLIDALSILTAFFVVFRASRTKKLILATPQIFLLLGFLGTIILSHLSHTYFWGAYNSFIEFSKTVIMFILFVNVLDSEKKLKISLWFIVLLTTILAIQGIYQFQNGIGWAGQPLTKTGRITWVGTLNDANDLALAIVMAIGFLLAFIFGRTNIISRVLSFLLAGVLLYALYLSNSRGGYLALAGSVLFYFLRRFRKKIIAIPLGGLLVFAIFVFGPSRLSEISASAFGRIEAWYQGMQMLKSSPLFGVGYGIFTEDYPLTAHSSYILVAAEKWQIGLFFWIALIYACFKGLSILRQKSPKLNSYISGIEASLVGFLGAAFFLSRSYKPIFYIILALACSFITHLSKKKTMRLA